MLTELELNAMADSFESIYSKVCERVIAEIGKNIAKTVDLTPAQAKAIQKMHIHGADMGKLDGILKQASGKSFSDLKAMYEYAVKDSYTWARPFYQNRGLTKIPTRFNQSLKQMLNAISQSSGKTLENLSRTTAIGVQTTKGFVPLEKFYKDAVNKGVLSVSTGTESYQKAVRKAVQELGGSGLRVQYESGYSRRLDSAVRQNVLDGMSYIAQESARIHGEAFGADGWELSAHAPCAPDHLPYQGLQYSKAEYEDLQASLYRPIGEWNCRHVAYPIVLGVSGTANSKEELAEMERYSNEKIEIDGREYTRYECTQLQRKLETEMRKAQEQRILFKNAGMKDLEREASQRMNQLANKYKEVSDKAGLPTRAERTRIVQGRLKEKVEYKGLYCYGDYLRDVLGSALKNNPEETAAIVKAVKTAGGEIEFLKDNSNMVTDMKKGRPAIIKVDENISIGGLKHEYRHFLDDIDNGNPGLGYYMQNPDEFFRLEKRGYEEELAIARELGYTDIEKKILNEIEQRRREIYGIK